MNRETKFHPGGRLWPLGIGLLVLAAVLIGMFLPSLISRAQSTRLESLVEIPELGAGELNLTSDDIKIKRLAMVSAMNNDGRGAPAEIVDLSSGRYMSADDAAAKLDDVLKLIDGTGLSIGSLSEKNLDWANAALLISESGDLSGVVMWEVNYYKSSGPAREWLSYLVDESTGMLTYVSYGIQDDRAYEAAAAEGAFRSETHNMQALVENMKKHYNFAETELRPQEVNDPTAVSDGIYYVSFLKNEQLMLNIQISFDGGSWTINR